MPSAPRRFQISLDGHRWSTSHLHHARPQLPKDRLLLTRPQLTPREIEVLTLVVRGNAYAHVAHCLSISEDTIKFHLEKVRRKLGAKNKAHAIGIAITNGLIEL